MRHETGMGEIRNIYKILAAATEGKNLWSLCTKARIRLKCTVRNGGPVD
jgi:hypothetical protein